MSVLDWLATPGRRKFLFGALYLTEGAPIGFIWLGLPTRLRAADVPLDRITWLLAALIIPWTFKFVWAPLVDWLHGPNWGLRHWILACQSCMLLTLIPLVWLDLDSDFSLITVLLLGHAVAAATQDVSIDALCISHTQPAERASLNGWMQCGMLSGRALLGGGGLVLEAWLGYSAVVLLLIGVVGFSAVLVISSREQLAALPPAVGESRWRHLLHKAQGIAVELWRAVGQRSAWAGLLFALIAPAAFKSLEAVIGPYLIDRSYTSVQVGQFTATFMIGLMIVGALFAGRIAAYLRARRLLALSLWLNVGCILGLAAWDSASGQRGGIHLLLMLSLTAITIGMFTVALYSWLMDLTSKAVAATQFTAFMAATNACEAWSTWLFGRFQSDWGYGLTMAMMCAISASASLLLLASETD